MPGKLSVNFLDVWKKMPPILLPFMNVFMHLFFLWPYQKFHDDVALLCRPAMPMASTVFHCMTRLVSFSCSRGAMEILDIQESGLSCLHSNCQIKTCVRTLTMFLFGSFVNNGLLPSAVHFYGCRCRGSRICIVPCRGTDCFCWGKEDWGGMLLYCSIFMTFPP